MTMRIARTYQSDPLAFRPPDSACITSDLRGPGANRVREARAVAHRLAADEHHHVAAQPSLVVLVVSGGQISTTASGLGTGPGQHPHRRRSPGENMRRDLLLRQNSSGQLLHRPIVSVMKAAGVAAGHDDTSTF